MLPLFSEPQLDDDEDEDTSENTDPRLLKLENAFLCAAIDMDDSITDLETAWTLATTRGFWTRCRTTAQRCPRPLREADEPGARPGEHQRGHRGTGACGRRRPRGWRGRGHQLCSTCVCPRQDSNLRHPV